MNVVAIKCENCLGNGIWYAVCEGTRPVRLVKCPVCNGTGMERPPVDHDKQARRIVEGETEDE